MNREELIQLGVPEEAVGQILQAQTKAVEDATRCLQERITHDRKRMALDTALRRLGAPEEAAALLALSVQDEEIELDDDGGMANANAVAQPLKERFAVLFAAPQSIPAGEMHPPRSGYTHAPQDIAQMSGEDINRDWDRVKDLLGRL